MATEKTVNYTSEQVTELVAAYTADKTQATVEAYAEKFGKSVRSIVAKLAAAGVYEAKAKTAGKRDMLKSEMVEKIAELLGKTPEQVESLEKATGPTLKAVLEALTAAKQEGV